jgi:hypothetical protein
MPKKIKVLLPKELADELASGGFAEIRQMARSATWELVWAAASTATEIVTLMQTPETVKTFAASCLRLARRSETKKEQRLDAVGPGGEMRLIIRPDTDFHEVERFLTKVLFTDTGSDSGNEAGG